MLVQYAGWNLLLDRRGEYEAICREAAERFGDLGDPGYVARAAALTNGYPNSPLEIAGA